LDTLQKLSIKEVSQKEVSNETVVVKRFLKKRFPMRRLLLVEDLQKDLQFAADTAYSLGITEVDARTSSTAARAYLEKALDGEAPLPDGIVLDLNLGYESGYELLRFWHRTPELSKIPIIVWSVLGDEQRDMCKLFNVNSFVGKWEGAAAFREALSSLGKSSS
jgi:CheY-like chemotaxis protein